MDTREIWASYGRECQDCGILSCAAAQIDTYHGDKPLLHSEGGAAGPSRTSVRPHCVTAQNVVAFVDTFKYVYFEVLALRECCAMKLVVGYRRFGTTHRFHRLDPGGWGRKLW
jgi:hypothetical protein